jgi:hypothetical protein
MTHTRHVYYLDTTEDGEAASEDENNVQGDGNKKDQHNSQDDSEGTKKDCNLI